MRHPIFTPTGTASVALTLCATLLGASPASAQDCIQDQWTDDGNNQRLTCTANDVRIAEADNIRAVDGSELTSCTEGSNFSFIADFTVELSAQERFDIGLYFGRDGDPNDDGALTGSCSVDTITAANSDTFVQLDAAPDSCGDINAANDPQIVTSTVTNVACVDTDNDGFLNLPNCTSWRQSGANEICTGAVDAFPGSPSKCNCDPDFNIPITVEPGTIDVTKNVVGDDSLAEPGGDFTFEVIVQSESQFTDITLESICDSDHGVIAVVDGESCDTGTLGAIDSTNCVLPQVLSPDDGVPGGTDEYSCTFTAEILSDTDAQEQDIVTVAGVNEAGQPVSDFDDATVFITDAEPEATVTKAFEGIECVEANYTVEVVNTSATEPLTLTALSDDAFGDLTLLDDEVTFTTCILPQPVAVGGSYSCTFTGKFCGTDHSNQVTATANDDDGTDVTPQSNVVQVIVSGEQQ